MKKLAYITLLFTVCTGAFSSVYAYELDSVFYKRLKKIEKNIPFDLNEDIQEAIKKRMYQDRTESEEVLSLSMNILPTIEKELWQNNIPSEFKYLPIAVSDLNPTAISPNGGVGIWELQYMTAIRYGLKVNAFVDERRDVRKSTKVAIRYLSDLHKKYNDWGLCLLAFVCSPAEVNSGINRAGSGKEVWKIFSEIDDPGKRNFVEFVAAAYLMNYYKSYDMKRRTPSKPVTYKSYKVDRSIDINDLCMKLGIFEKELRKVNPLLRGTIIPKDAGIELNIPTAYTSRFESIKDTLPVVEVKNTSKTIEIDRKYYFDTPTHNKDKNNTVSNKDTRKNTPTESTKEKVYYKVVRGDNLGRIARKYGVTVNSLKYWNRLKSDLIYVGQKLVIYRKKKSSGTTKTTTKKDNTKKKNTTNTKKQTTSSNNKKDKTSSSGGWITYTVKSGDSVWRIAQKFGVSESSIVLNNRIKGNLIHPGDVLKIKKK